MLRVHHVAETFDVDGHQAADDPVFGQAQNADQNTDDGRGNTAQKRDKQCIQDTNKGCAPVAVLVIIFDQHLVDVVTRSIPEEAEVEIFAQRFEVLNGVVHQPVDTGNNHHQRNHLNGYRTIAGIIDKLAQPKRWLRWVCQRRHCILPMLSLWCACPSLWMSSHASCVCCIVS